MELEMCVAMIKHVNAAHPGTPVQMIVGEDDSSSFAQVCAEVRHDVHKFSDKNHILKIFMADIQKIRGLCKMSQPTALYVKLFAYVVAQNVDNPTGIEESLDSMINMRSETTQHVGRAGAGTNVTPQQKTGPCLTASPSLTQTCMKPSGLL
jgi:hypothetical protein